MSLLQGKLTEVVSVRFTANEVERLRLLAEGRPLSHLVRELCLEAAKPTRLALGATSQTSHQTDLLTIAVNTSSWSAPEMSHTAWVVAGSETLNHRPHMAT
jgi:hypothetical protein